MNISKKIYEWACCKVAGRYAALWLGAIFALELVLILPLDAVLVFFCLHNKSRRYLFAIIATLGSLLSGVAGYLLGRLLWDSIGTFVVGHLLSPDFFHRLIDHYAQNEALAVLIGSLLPVPLKAISLSAGFCQIPFVPFLFYILLARAVRFFLVAVSVQQWGEKIALFFDRHFSHLFMAMGAKVLLTLGFFFLLT